MQNATFKYVEDYIEYIAGYRTANGKSLMFFEKTACPISLARYDVKIIESLALQTNENNRSYTDKQAELAVKIIHKYVRQLTNLGIVLPDVLDTFRFGIREVDRTKKIFLHNGKIILKFPYDLKLVPVVKKYSKESDGFGKFDYDAKVWILGLTEPMLNWAMTFAVANKFEISEEVDQLYKKLLEVEKQKFKIELVQQNNQLTIVNSQISLINYIDKNLGGISYDNLLKLVDSATVLGYTVSEDIVAQVQQQYQNFWPIISNKQVSLSSKHYTIDLILEYAELTNRTPVYYYDNESKSKNVQGITYLNKMSEWSVAPKLLITKSAMMIGPKRQSWLTNSEKIVVLE